MSTGAPAPAWPSSPFTSPVPPTEVWGSAAVDVGSYLARIGYDGPLAPTSATLRALHRAHVTAVLFENLTVMVDGTPALDVAALQRKIVTGSRGGYCFELGLLAGALLERLGYPTRRLLARTADPLVDPRPRSHLVLVAHADDRWWVVDVGFGSGPLEPLPLVDGAVVPQDGWTWRVTRGSEGWWRVQQQVAGDWQTQYTLADESVFPVDVAVANESTATSPSSPFTRQPIVVRREGGVERRLIGRDLTLARHDGRQETRTLSDAAYAEELRHYGLELTPHDLRTVTARLPAKA